MAETISTDGACLPLRLLSALLGAACQLPLPLAPTLGQWNLSAIGGTPGGRSGSWR